MDWLIYILIPAVLVIVFYILYVNGLMVISVKKALFFRGDSLGVMKNSTRAEFSSCSGYLKRILKFKETGVYEFRSQMEIESGSAAIVIVDDKGIPVVTADSENTSQRAQIEKGRKYHIIVKLKKAKGRYAFSWNRI